MRAVALASLCIAGCGAAEWSPRSLHEALWPVAGTRAGVITCIGPQRAVTAGHVVQGHYLLSDRADRRRWQVKNVTAGMFAPIQQSVDLALLSGTCPTHLTLATHEPPCGEAVWALGNPELGALSRGVVTPLSGDLIAADITARVGSSGGPLVAHGEVVGIIVGSSGGFTVAVPALRVRRALGLD